AKRKRTAVDGSLSAAVELYKTLHVATLRKGTRDYLNRELGGMLAMWPGRALASITKADINALLDAAEKRGLGAVDTTWKVVKSFFRWATDDRDLIAANPAASIRRRHKDRKRKRERFLFDHELRAVWHAAEKTGGPAGAFIKLLILTGCRRTEIGSLK